ncbi:MAG: hypothetical protein AAF449_12710 [Myxococcota bacterium]
MFAVLIWGLTHCSGAPTPSSDSASIALQNLSGTYADPAPYTYGDAFGHRTFTFDRGTWTLAFVLSLDPDQKQQIFSFETRGSYRILGPSEEVPGAYNALFREDIKLLTVHTDNRELRAAFGFEPCGLQTDVQRDISATGCSFWKSVAECAEDHDLLMLTPDEGLRFGVRPPDNDMCTAERRPTSLTPAVVLQSP